jgi:hypothetical protein
MHTKLRPLAIGLITAAALGSWPATAQEREPAAGVPRLNLQVGGLSAALEPRPAMAAIGVPADAAAQVKAPEQPTLVEYSDAYRTRAKIHRIAAFTTLPLFVTEAFLGQSLYDDPTEGKKSAHLGVAAAMGGLFAVNGVTGVWNMVEARKDRNGRGRRLLHGLLMLAADAGFVATAALAPDDDDLEEGRSGEGGGSRSTHRAVAFTSIGLASAGYLMMLIGGR